MTVITKEDRAQLNRIRPLLKKWQKIFGLSDWDLHHVLVVDGLSDEGTAFEGSDFSPAAEISVYWEYKVATLYFSKPVVEQVPDETLELFVVHELTHIHLNEMRDYEDNESGHKHEERSATEFTSTILRAFESGVKEGKRATRQVGN